LTIPSAIKYARLVGAHWVGQCGEPGTTAAKAESMGLTNEKLDGSGAVEAAHRCGSYSLVRTASGGQPVNARVDRSAGRSTTPAGGCPDGLE
jgi:hypothetical protein